MSGGHFDYKQFELTRIADDIRTLIRNNKRENEWGDINNYPKEILIEFQKAINLLEMAEIYTHRIDWLVSGDDSEETFHERLKEDLEGKK
jgi:hypothetical protein